MKNNMRIGFVGLTHLGLVSSICAAEKGFNLVCYDSKTNLIEMLNNFDLPIEEPGLIQLLRKNKKTIKFTSNFIDLKDLDIIYVAPDIPTDQDGFSDLHEIRAYLSDLKKIDSKDKIIVVLSQVPPGFTREFSSDFNNLYYQVETLVFGSAVERSLYPERFILGLKDSRKKIMKKFELFLDAYKCPLIPMRYESAELAKISINMFLVSSVTTSNLIAELCEKIGANFSEIIPALQLDKRIGKFAYLAPGLGISGGNLERDLTTFINFSKDNKSDCETVKSWQANSQHRKEWPYMIIKENILSVISQPRILILGLSYKPNTHSIKNSPTIKLLEKLTVCTKYVFDPIIKSYDGSDTVMLDSIDNESFDYDVLVIMNQSDEFKTIDHSKLKSITYFIDPFRVLDDEKLPVNSKVFHLGS